MYLTVCFWFLISFVMGGAGRLCYLTALEGWYGPWNLPQIHYLGKWEGVEPWKSRVFGPQMEPAYRLDAISLGLKTIDFQDQPLSIALVMDLHTSKTLPTGRINHRCINIWYPQVQCEARVVGSVPHQDAGEAASSGGQSSRRGR